LKENQFQLRQLEEINKKLKANLLLAKRRQLPRFVLDRHVLTSIDVSKELTGVNKTISSVKAKLQTLKNDTQKDERESMSIPIVCLSLKSQL